MVNAGRCWYDASRWRKSIIRRINERSIVYEETHLPPHGAFFALPVDETAKTFPGTPLKDEIVLDGFRYYIDYPVSFGQTLDGVAASSNMLQQWAESSALGIPMMLNCDPSSMITGQMSNMAQAATFDTEKVLELSKTVARIYRAVGITMVLSPQVDLLTDPRSHTTGAFSEDPLLAADMTNATLSGYQSTYDEEGNDLGWGSDSLTVQFKHFFGNTANDGGRNYHNYTGKYTVVPEEQLEAQLAPFVLGGFKLNSKTQQAAAIMVTYTVLCDEDGDPIGDYVGGAWNEYIMDTAKEYGFEGMISTDAISENTAYNKDISDIKRTIYEMFSKCIHQFMGGSATIENMRGAYEIYIEEEGQEAADENWKTAAYQCALPIFRCGNFENPYVNAEDSNKLLAELIPDVYSDIAQSSIVMIKNTDSVIAAAGEAPKNVYIVNEDPGISKKTLKNNFNVVDTPEEADIVLVFVQSPQKANTGYDEENQKWVPITLQYGEYTADSDAVPEESVTGDYVTVEIQSPYGPVTSTEKENRSYYDETAIATNAADLDLIHAAAATGKPVVVCVSAGGAFCVHGFESEVVAILIGYGVDKSNFLPIVAGTVEPCGLLPVQMPLNMETVEAQQSGTPRDMECYVDADGNAYDFAFGMNWSGVINDVRVEKYGAPALMAIE